MVDFISAADFEKKMRDIDSDKSIDAVRKLDYSIKLMCNTLRTLGYDAGVDVFVGKRRDSNGRSYDE